MRRISILLAIAALALAGAVGYTYRLRLLKDLRAKVAAAPEIKTGYEAVAPTGWRYQKDDPQSGKPVVRVEAQSFQATHDPSTFELRDLRLRLYAKSGESYTFVKSSKALFDERSGLMKSEGPVTIVMNVPIDRRADDPAEMAKRVHVQTTGVTYETKTGKANTDQFASFVFPDGNGSAKGAEYNPNTKVLHLKSKVSLNWVGTGPIANQMHVETQDLVYKEAEQKVYLKPSAKLTRQNTTIQAQNAVVRLDRGVLHQIDGEHASGGDTREGRTTTYSADKMTALFDENGELVNIVGQNHAKVMSRQPSALTTLTGDRADLRFSIDQKSDGNGGVTDASNLHLVMADGHALAESVPVAQAGVLTPDTRILRSEHIELEMKPGGQDVQEIRTSSQAQLEFKPNRPDQPHRVVDASHLRVVYGAESYVDTFFAWNVNTHTDRPAPQAPKAASGSDKKPVQAAPALTWSDELIAKFQPNSNQVATIEQKGNFRYEEGVRKASATRALLNQTLNRMTLIDNARVLDDTGSALADTIVMNQANGDMDAKGHVISTHAPNRNQKPGTSMLDDSEPMQAKADEMLTRENHTKVHYEGHAVMWQGANRVTAQVLDIDRDNQELHASGNVVSELVDNRSSAAPGSPAGSDPKAQSPTGTSPSAPPVYTTVYAPELMYRDDTRVANYTGNVKLTRQKMIITSKELQAFLTPKSQTSSNESSLDHAVAAGDVTIFDQIAENRTRTGTSDRCEYYTKNDKVVLNGGTPQVNDSYKGVTKGRQLTFYNGDDHLLVEGEKKQLAFTQMRKK
jgi:lipopolysaccharide export system protein LptA